MSFEQLFRDYWWLIFPLGWMVMGVFGMISHHHHRSETLRLLKSYADQGKEPPAFLLDTLRSDEDRAYAHRGRRYYRYRGYRGFGWGKIAVFGALAVGFYYYGQDSHTSLFTALGLAFGVAATVWFVITVGQAIFGPKLRDYPDDLEKRDRLDD